ASRASRLRSWARVSASALLAARHRRSRMTRSLLLSPALLASLLALGACRQPPSSGAKEASAKKSGPTTAELTQRVHGLEAEVAALRSRLGADAPVRELLPAINTHEHLLEVRHLDRYLPAARAL